MFEFNLVYMRYSLIFILFFLFHFSISARDKIKINAEPTWLQKINPDLNKVPPPKTISNGYYLELSDNQYNLINKTKYTHYIRHIINESGVQNASEVSVTFSPEFEQVIFHKINIIRDGKIISQLSANQVRVVQEETDASDFQYNGLKRAFVTLKNVQKNDRIEVSYSISGANPVFNHKFSATFSFYNETAITNFFLTLITDEKKRLFFKTFNDAVKPAERSENNVHIYQWSNPKLSAYEDVPDAPSWFINYSYVTVTEYNNWEEVVKWGLDIFKNYNYQLPEDLKIKIAKWHKIANGDNDLFATMAIRFVQDQVRYLGLEMGTYTHQPHSPAEVYSHRFGDCKDKALLLALILKHENIEAYVALLNTDKRNKLLEAAPSATVFDHAIVAIKRSSTYIFIDPTISSQRGELVNLYVPAYGYALVLRDGENKLQPVEPGFLFNTSVTETLNVEYTGASSFKVATVYSGGAADDMRSSYADISNKELDENCRKFYEKIFDGIEIEQSAELGDDTLKNEIALNESYTIPNLWRVNEKGRQSFEVFSKSVWELVPDPSSTVKNTPLALRFPRTIRYSMEINMPDTWNLNVDELHIKNNSYQFDFVPVLTGKHMSMQYFFKTLKDNIAAEDIQQYKTEYKQMQDIIDIELFKTNNVTDKQTEPKNLIPSKSVNFPVVWFSFILIALYTTLLIRLNKRKEEVQYTYETGSILGGWTIVLGITICLSLLVELFYLINTDYFSNTIWATLGNLGGNKLQYIFLAELGFLLIRIGGVISLIYWFFGRRDIFPKMFIWYMGFLIASQLIIFITYSIISLPPNFSHVRTEIGINLLRVFVYASVWITYVRRSERVKFTFLQPFKK